MELLKDLLNMILNLLSGIFSWTAEHFLNLNIFGKGLVLSYIPAFLAVIKPAAKYRIFDSWFYINNPSADTLICIMILVTITFFIRKPLVSMLLRMIPSFIYLAVTVYLHAGKTVSKAPYTLTGWFILSYIVPVLIMTMALGAWYRFEGDKK